MNILLFNDNPVVRKLVALSAQKTKDDLSVVWSADEIEEGKYDLLIVDDGLYDDEVFDTINSRIDVQSRLLMATRGKAVPAGFDNVINKPFLPTDLVDMLVQIEKKIASLEEYSAKNTDDRNTDESAYSINLEDTLSDFQNVSLDEYDAEESEDEYDIDALENSDEKLTETTILDHEEVQEVQGLLEEADLESSEPDESLLDGIDSFELSADDESALLDEPFDMGSLSNESEISGDLLEFEEALTADEIPLPEKIEVPELLEDEEFDATDAASLEEELESEEFDIPTMEQGEEEAEEELFSLDESVPSIDESLIDEDEFSSLMDDEELGELEVSIQNAVDTLDDHEFDTELDMENLALDLDESLLEELEPILSETSTESSDLGMSSDFDELDSLDVKELKRAVGEAVEEESVLEPSSDELCTDISSTEENVNASENIVIVEKSEKERSTAHAEGIDAIQTLLKTLANEEVAKSLKGLNISININFGNDK